MPADSHADPALLNPATPASSAILRKVGDALSGSRERRLVRRAQAGSEEAIEELFRLYWPLAFRAANYITRDAAAAEDIAQEAFLAAVRKIDSFDRSRPFGPWFKRVVANRAIDWTRARQLRAKNADPSELDAAREGESFPPSDGQLPDEISAAIARLPLDQRTAIVLRHLLDYSPGEIAELLGVPRGTVNSRLRRGLDALRDQLEER